MTRSMTLRQRGVLLALLAAFFLTISGSWATDAESKPRPASQDNFAEVQLLTFNDFHGNLEPVSTSLPAAQQRGERPTSAPTSTSTSSRTPTELYACTPETRSADRP
jgi:2',3'-cyclic-nucleotide 2'-phosphodiesterase (5'-nucleotidase family)